MNISHATVNKIDVWPRFRPFRFHFRHFFSIKILSRKIVSRRFATTCRKFMTFSFFQFWLFVRRQMYEMSSDTETNEPEKILSSGIRYIYSTYITKQHDDSSCYSNWCIKFSNIITHCSCRNGDYRPRNGRRLVEVQNTRFKYLQTRTACKNSPKRTGVVGTWEQLRL